MSEMKWISVEEKLPPTHHRVMVCRELRIKGFKPFYTHDIGHLEGTGEYDRWRLESQEYSPLPCTPTVGSKIITYWAELPELPKQDKGE